MEDCSPMCVYIPSNEVMFKMMKACLEVEKVEDLWMYSEKYSKMVDLGDQSHRLMIKQSTGEEEGLDSKREGEDH